MKAKTFFKEGSVLLIATFTGSFFNYLFNISMGRFLGPSDYSVMMSLLSLLMIVSVPVGAVQTIVAKYVAGFQALNKMESIKNFLSGIVLRILLFSTIIFIVLISFSKVIANYLNISGVVPVLIVSTILIPLVLLPAIRGALQGLQKFYSLGINITSEGLIRLLVGVFLVYFGFGVNGAIGATTLSSIFALVIAILAIKQFLFKKSNNMDVSKSFQFREVYQYTGPVLISLFCITILTNIDLILVKHYFSAEEAGIYSGAEIIGKIVFYLPAPISVFIFPKAAYSHAINEDTKEILWKGFLSVVFVSGLLTLLYFVFPEIFILTFFGEKYIQSTSFLGLFGIAMSFYAVVNLLIFYKLSIHQFKFIYSLVAVTLLQILLLFIFHAKLTHVIYTLIFCSFLLIIFNLKEIIYRKS